MKSTGRLESLLYGIRDEFGRSHAVQIIREIGKANFLHEIDPSLHASVIEYAENFITERRNPATRLLKAAAALRDTFQAFRVQMEQMMSDGMKNLREGVESAVTEMTRAGDYIKNHPAAQNDPELMSMGDKLKAAAAALGAVDVDAVVSSGGAGGPDTGGTVSNGGTVSSG